MMDKPNIPAEREPRVVRRDADEAVRSEPVLRESFERFITERGKVPNLFRVAAHCPEIARTWSEHQRAVMGPGHVPVVLKELISVRVSQLNDCEY